MANLLLIIIIIELAAIWLQRGRFGKELNERIESWMVRTARARAQRRK